MKINVLQQAFSISGRSKQTPTQIITLKLITSWQLASVQSSKLVLCMDSQKEKVHFCFRTPSRAIPTDFSILTTTVTRLVIQEVSMVAFPTLPVTPKAATDHCSG